MKVIFVFLMFISIIFIFSCKKENDIESENLKIQEFYLGMSPEEVVELLNGKYWSYYSTRMGINIKYKNSDAIQSNNGEKIKLIKDIKVEWMGWKEDGSEFYFGENQKLESFKLINAFVDYIFESQNLKIDEFVKYFSKLNNVSEMKTNKNYYSFINGIDYELIITNDKQIIYQKINNPILEKDELESFEEGVLKIKGFYLGMSPEKVVELLREKHKIFFRTYLLIIRYNNSYKYEVKFDEKDEIQLDKDKQITWISRGGIQVDFDENRKAIKINLGSSFSNYIFNSEDLSSSEFVQAFVDSYNIPEMKTEEKYVSEYYTKFKADYTNRMVGYHLNITNKSITIEKIQKASETKFGD